MQLTPGQFARLSKWFDEAAGLPPSGREVLIERVRRDEGDEMALQLANLLNAHDRPTDTMDQPWVPLPPPAADEESAFREDEVILGRFRIVRLLGRGGMGEVYEAQDQELGPVALKTIRRDLLGDRAVLRRFKQEVQLAREVTSPNVCRIHELFMLPGPLQDRVAAFLTMELLKGMTLAKRIEQGPLPWSEAEPIAIELCQGLEALHTVGLVHRDFKPGNAMLARRGNVTQAVVMDLGLALRPEESQRGQPKLTVTGGIVGTPGYMAPEQFEGANVSAATDIYALGLVLYEMTTGRRPFEASTPMAAAVRRAKRPPRISSIQPGLPRRLDRVVEKCLEFEPADRFGSVGAVAKALRGETADVTDRTKFSTGTTQQRWAMAILMTAALLTVLTAAFLFWNRIHSGSGGGSVEARRWYNQGTAALREGTYLKAAAALQRAVDLDKNFVLGHVRLADAWNELDFASKAKDEMLEASAIESRGRLSALDQRYVEAIRHTIVRDFPAALQNYQDILSSLPGEMQASGYVDVGRAHEKAGNIDQAITSYTAAAKLDSQAPAAFVRLGVLKSRRKQTAEADAAFSKAESLYSAASNLEGIAEIDFERGNDANTQLQLTEAREYLRKSLQAAKAIPSLQLEIRALTRLSVTEYLGRHTDESIALANQAIALAQDNAIEYWAIDGRIRLGNAFISRADYENAATQLEQALILAERGQHPRLIALAQLSLASVRARQNKPGEAIPLAKGAFDYYRPMGFASESVDALTQIVRAQRDLGDNQAALKTGQELLASAMNLDKPAVIMRAEDALGSVLLDLERYPEALDHFQRELSASRLLNANIEYSLLHYADTVWRLGDYAGAERTLAALPAASRTRSDVATGVAEVTTDMFFSQGRYAAAKQVAQRSLANKTNVDPGYLERLMCEIETVSGSPAPAEEWCRKAIAQARQESDPRAGAAAELSLANAYLAAGSAAQALPVAKSARDFFTASGQNESEYLSLLSLAKILRALKNTVDSKQSAQEGLDILARFKHNWSPQQYKGYSGRRDVRESTDALLRLRKN
jgi:Tfp pilus assembly protein PilF